MPAGSVAGLRTVPRETITAAAGRGAARAVALECHRLSVVPQLMTTEVHRLRRPGGSGDCDDDAGAVDALVPPGWNEVVVRRRGGDRPCECCGGVWDASFALSDLPAVELAPDGTPAPRARSTSKPKFHPPPHRSGDHAAPPLVDVHDADDVMRWLREE